MYLLLFVTAVRFANVMLLPYRFCFAAATLLFLFCCRYLIVSVLLLLSCRFRSVSRCLAGTSCCRQQPHCE
ncbi:hypothetical protein [Methanimicrococcus blatticola]|uniref:hypothetical protein n=1 Tax=Methanimicrococcus blatticola TaxID=91560 RepID=UPI00105EC891|nr:hypothetical protein [Methanimicrococcus blatticola]MBZ3934994.1 hypothetical protein [Methanimicrococcus blatticola]MCC2508908.1 hypothetical protein [Methanimicrococcus blatticola]